MSSLSASALPTSPTCPASPGSLIDASASSGTANNNNGASMHPTTDNLHHNTDDKPPRSDSSPNLSRASSSSLSGRFRSASLRLAEASIPTGAWSGIGQSVGKAPSLVDLRRGSISSAEQNTTATSLTRQRGSSLGQKSRPRDGTTGAAAVTANRHSALLEKQEEDEGMSREEQERRHKETEKELEAADACALASAARVEDGTRSTAELSTSSEKTRTTRTEVRDANRRLSALPHRVQPIPNELGVYPNGYHFPPKKTWTQATTLGLKGLWHFTLTPTGFLIVLYGCNVVAWGGMLFLLLCGAGPDMCRLGDGRYDCNDIDSPRRIWIEIDSQILTVLFCITAFGLAPWRFRDLWYWTAWRLGGSQHALRKLAGYKKGWFRMRGSDDLPDDLGPQSGDEDFVGIDEVLYPIPKANIPSPPLTGARAPASAYWKMDFVVWAMVWNTLFQCVLCGFMWGMNRFDRPSWATGLFVALGCIVAGVGGIMEMVEGKRVKGVEGVPIDTANAMADLESGGQSAGKDGTKTNTDEKVPAP